MLNPDPFQDLEDDPFGLGNFEHVFITEQSLEAAKEKLDQVKTNEESIQELLLGLLSHTDPELFNEQSVLHGWVKIGYRGFNLGIGTVSFLLNGFLWKGDLITPEGNTKQSQLAYPRTKLQKSRLKHISENCHLLHFKFNGDDHEIYLDFEQEREAKALEQHMGSVEMVVPKETYETHLEKLLNEKREKIRAIEREYDEKVADLAFQYGKVEQECQLCFDGVAETILLPCQHALCTKCGHRLLEYNLPCPWDRIAIDALK